MKFQNMRCIHIFISIGIRVWKITLVRSRHVACWTYQWVKDLGEGGDSCSENPQYDYSNGEIGGKGCIFHYIVIDEWGLIT